MSNEIEALRATNMGLRKRIATLEAEHTAYEAHVLAQYAAYDKSLCDLRLAISGYKAREAEAALKAIDAPPPGEDKAPPPPRVVN